MTRPKARKFWAERFVGGGYITWPSKRDAEDGRWSDSTIVRLLITELHPRKKARRG